MKNHTNEESNASGANVCTMCGHEHKDGSTCGGATAAKNVCTACGGTHAKDHPCNCDCGCGDA